MMLRSLAPLAALTIALLPALVRAQETTASEDERLEALARANAEIYVPRNTISVGFRVLTSGANVHFGALGQIPYQHTPDPASSGNVTRLYDNGQVNSDFYRSDEIDTAFGVPHTTPGTHYVTYGSNTTSTPDPNSTTNPQGNVDNRDTQVIVSDSLAYTPGQTRSWIYTQVNQILNMPDGSQYVAMSNYGTTTNGASLDHRQGPAIGVEFQLDHNLSKPGARFQFGWQAGISINDINSKIAGVINANLKTTTDYYLANPEHPVGNQIYDPNTATDSRLPHLIDTSGTDPIMDFSSRIDGILIIPGQPKSTGGEELNVPLSQTPVDIPGGPASGTEVITNNAASVIGRWQIKGDYFMVRLGPSMKAQLTESLSVSASAGLAGSYCGTRYTAEEKVLIPGNDPTVATTATIYVTAPDEESISNKFLSGYYANFNFEWAANERTGFFGGVSTQKLSTYDQTLGGRTAHIDVGSAVGLRGGLTIKF